MLTLTESQRAALLKTESHPAPISIRHFGMLRDLGLVERHTETPASRGYVGAAITAAGKSYLEN